MSPLSLPLENTAIMRVPFSILARMYQRASLILARNEENIHPNPRRVDNLPRYVAEMDCSLTELIHCYKATKQRPPNVDALIQMNLPPGRGSKKTKATQRRKRTTN